MGNQSEADKNYKYKEREAYEEAKELVLGAR